MKELAIDEWTEENVIDNTECFNRKRRRVEENEKMASCSNRRGKIKTSESVYKM